MDDELIVTRALARGLGGEVVVEADGRAALERLAADRACGRSYDVVIADLNMPRMSGVELFTAMAEDPAVRILMSGTSEVPESPGWRSIVKPFTVAELRELIRVAMASRSG